jgi:CRP/FNR family transcriptional regulator, cyclic AMP receptor protein
MSFRRKQFNSGTMLVQPSFPPLNMALFSKLFGAARDPDAPESRLPAERHAAVSASSSAHEAARLLRAPTALMQLSEAEALTVVSFMQPRRFASGTTIIRQGEATDTGFMVLVLNGEITVENLIARRVDPVTVNVLGPGSLIGEMALVDGAARSATCTASTDVQCAVLTREALEALITEQPATAAKLMTAVAQRLAERLRESIHKQQIYSKLVQTLQQELEALMPTPQ